MPCLVLLLALLAPRVCLVLMWLFTHYLGRAYQTALWPLLGFCLMPVTTIAYAVCQNEGGGVHDGWIVVLVLAILIDAGVIGGAQHDRQRRWQR